MANITFEFSVVLIVVILPQILSSLYMFRNNNLIRNYSSKERIFSGLLNYLGTILLLTYIAIGKHGGLSYLGLSLEKEDVPKVFGVGGLATGYLLLIFVVGKLRSKEERERRETFSKDAFEAGAFSLYQGFWEKVFFLPILWLGVVAEELVYRGYLILSLGNETGVFIPWILFSIACSMGVHLYQGVHRRVVFTHIVFAGVFIIAVLTTKNLIAAIIPHLIYDTVWILRGWIKFSKEEPVLTESMP